MTTTYNSSEPRKHIKHDQNTVKRMGMEHKAAGGITYTGRR
jgi:hypothetical protein